MNEETPIEAADPFRTCRIAAAALSLLTALLVGVVAIDLARRPKAGDQRWAVGRIVHALAAPVADMAGIDTRYGSMVPNALHDTDGAGWRGPWGSRP